MYAFVICNPPFFDDSLSDNQTEPDALSHRIPARTTSTAAKVERATPVWIYAAYFSDRYARMHYYSHLYDIDRVFMILYLLTVENSYAGFTLANGK